MSIRILGAHAVYKFWVAQLGNKQQTSTNYLHMKLVVGLLLLLQMCANVHFQINLKFIHRDLQDHDVCSELSIGTI
jgi:hypothetical protein